MVELATSFLFAPHFSSSLLSRESICSCVMCRLVHAIHMPLSNLDLLYGSLVPSLLITIRELNSCLSNVVKRCEHFGHSRLLRTARPSSASLESMTDVSCDLQCGQCMVYRLLQEIVQQQYLAIYCQGDRDNCFLPLHVQHRAGSAMFRTSLPYRSRKAVSADQCAQEAFCRKFPLPDFLFLPYENTWE